MEFDVVSKREKSLNDFTTLFVYYFQPVSMQPAVGENIKAIYIFSNV